MTGFMSGLAMKRDVGQASTRLREEETYAPRQAERRVASMSWQKNCIQHPSIIQGSLNLLNGAAFWVGSNNAKSMVDLRDFT